jgi:hypothetical protein
MWWLYSVGVGKDLWHEAHLHVMRTPLLEGVCKGAGLEGDNGRVIAPESISWVGEDEAWEGGVGEWSSFSGAHDNTEV